MAAYDNLRAVIAANVYQNNNNEVTADMVKTAMEAMVASLGAEFQFGGVAAPTDNPGTPDQNVFYIAGPGEYPNFSNATVADGYIGVFKYNGSWTVETVKVGKDYDQQIVQLQQDINNIKFVDESNFNLAQVVYTTGLLRYGEKTVDGLTFVQRAYVRHNTLACTIASSGSYGSWQFPIQRGKVYKLVTRFVTDDTYEPYSGFAILKNVIENGGKAEASLLNALANAQGGYKTIYFIAPIDGYVYQFVSFSGFTTPILYEIDTDQLVNLVSLTENSETHDGELKYLQTVIGYIDKQESAVAEFNHAASSSGLATLKYTNLNAIAEESYKALSLSYNTIDIIGSVSWVAHSYIRAASLGIVVGSSGNYGIWKIPVVKGGFYKIVRKFSTDSSSFNIYAGIAFSVDDVVDGNKAKYSYRGPVGTGTDEPFYFIAPENGFVLVWETNQLYAIVEAKRINVNSKIDDGGGNVNVVPFPKRNIACAGSSITWGNGSIDGSMVGAIDKYIKESLSNTVTPEQVNAASSLEIENGLMYRGVGVQISGVGAKLSFKIVCDEIAICQMKKRTTDYGIFTIKADGVLCGTYDNYNEQKHTSESFAGSNIQQIRLSHPCTYNHQIVINGVTQVTNIVINKGGAGATMPEDCEAWVVRGLDDNGNPVHFIRFADSLGSISSVNVEYDFGRIITHERSTVGQTDNANENESNYGLGSVEYDPENPQGGPSSGLEFRAIDERAFVIYKFDSFKEREIEIEIVGGVNPYFVFNYATNRFNNLMNAGIGGWTIGLFMDDDHVNDYTQLYKWFVPDILFSEFATNDDWSYKTRRIRRSIGEISLQELLKLHTLEAYSVTYNSVTDKYAVEMCTGIISSVNPFGLTSQDIIGTDTAIGDIVRIGTYRGDNGACVCRKITGVNLETGSITWAEPINADELLDVDTINDLVGKEINIRNLASFKTRYQNLINAIRGVSPQTKIVIISPGNALYWLRQLWGYEIIFRELCNENHNIVFSDVKNWLYDWQRFNISGAKSETIQSTGASEYEMAFNENHKSWQGFRVLVDGIDVYGKDCYISVDYGYHPNSSLSGSDQNFASPLLKRGVIGTVSPMKLVFYKNAPVSGKQITIQFANYLWSNDFCHPSEIGAMLYAQKYSEQINL